MTYIPVPPTVLVLVDIVEDVVDVDIVLVLVEAGELAVKVEDVVVEAVTVVEEEEGMEEDGGVGEGCEDGVIVREVLVMAVVVDCEEVVEGITIIGMSVVSLDDTVKAFLKENYKKIIFLKKSIIYQCSPDTYLVRVTMTV